jgi:hypothetical protein
MTSDIAKRVRDMAKRRLEAIEQELADDAPEPETSDPERPQTDA